MKLDLIRFLSIIAFFWQPTSQGLNILTPVVSNVDDLLSDTTLSVNSALQIDRRPNPPTQKPTPKPEPTKDKPEPKPTKPEPTKDKPEPKPTKPEPTKDKPEPKPTKPEPTKDKPEPKPTKPEPTKDKPEPKPTKPEPTKDKPDPKPTKPDPKPEPPKDKPHPKPTKPEPPTPCPDDSQFPNQCLMNPKSSDSWKLIIRIYSCPDSETAASIKLFAQEISTALRSTLGIDSTINFILPIGCGTQITSGVMALEGSSHNVVELLSTNGAIVEMTEEFSIINSQRESISVEITPGHYISTSTQTTYFSIDCKQFSGPTTQKCIRLQSLADISSVNTHVVISDFFCNVRGAVPIPFLDGNQVRRCQCECPSGKIYNANQRACIDTPSRCNCNWGNKCYDFSQKELQKSTCKINNLLSRTTPPLGVVPFPKDNYVSGESVPGPKIELSVSNGYSDIFTWADFEDNHDAIINAISFQSTGTYTVTLKAYDWSNSPAVCTTTIKITDGYRPTASKNTCPLNTQCDANAPTTSWTYNGVETKTCLISWNPENFNLADNIDSQNFVTWVNSRENDICGALGASANGNCDDHLADSIRFIGGTTAAINVEAPNAQPIHPFTLAQPDFVALTINNPVGSGQPIKYQDDTKFCLKCVSYDYTFKEKVNNFLCGGDKPDQCLKGDSCKYSKCLLAKANTFFTASVTLNPTIAQETLDLIQNFFPGENYNNINQIHLGAECDDAQSTCVIQRSISSFFDPVAGYNPSFASQFAANPISQFVKFQFRVNGGQWLSWDQNADTLYPFSLSVTRVQIQAVTQCGTLIELEFEVFVHSHNNPSICSSLATTMIYQGTRPEHSTGDSFCNNYESDFVEVTFDFQTGMGNTISEDSNGASQLMYEFVSLQCSVRYGDTPFVDNVISFSATNDVTSYIKRMAFNLINKPTRINSIGTVPQMQVEFKCFFNYAGANGATLTKVCPRIINLKDCDRPGWDCPWGSCQKTCKDRKPNQVCGGLQFSYQQPDPANSLSVATIVETGDKPCCKDCDPLGGPPAKCKSLPGLPDGSIKICVVSTSVLQQSLASVKNLVATKPMFSFAIVLGAFGTVLAVAYFVRSKITKESVTTDDGYAPLL